MVDVFISYSRDDKDKVAVLARMIASEGYDVWWDADLPAHMSYGDVITAKIGAAKAAVVVWSDTAAKSEWVRAEADVARNQKKLIQTALDDTMPPLPFNQIQCAEIGDWAGEADHRGWSKVKQSLVALCGPRDSGGDAASMGDMAGEISAPPAPAPAAASVPASAPPPTQAPPPSSNPPSSNSPPSQQTPKNGMSTPLIIAIGCGALSVFAVIILVVLAMIGAAIEDPANVASGDIDEPSAEAMLEPQSQPQSQPPVDAPLAQTDGDFIPQLDQAPSAADQPAMMETLLIATVQDPDGYTNVRAGPSADTAIIGQIEVGDVFTTYQQNTPWWSVLLEDGTEGYIYSDRIFVIGPQ